MVCGGGGDGDDDMSIIIEPRELTLHWIQSLTCTLNSMFPLYMLVGLLLVPPYTSY